MGTESLHVFSGVVRIFFLTFLEVVRTSDFEFVCMDPYMTIALLCELLALSVKRGREF